VPKTVWIVPKETLSGGRCDGRPWPPAGTPIDVPDWEAEHAVNAGWAYYHEPPAPDPDPGAVQPPAPEVSEAGHPAGNLVPEPPAAEAVQEVVPDPVPVPEPEDDDPDPPRPSDPKQDWVAYAQSRGMSPVTAAAMSKADLMSRFGGRL